ncbi:efflux RND transporter periplasmic adaptor subunit [bacterium]|nr:efflux RND transporter periplasmic adaptor subunit [bacterium]
MNKNRRRWVIGGGGSILLVIIVLITLSRTSGGSAIPTYPLSRGTFVISLTETGELRAQNSVVITAPPVRTNLQIVSLAPKGAEVEIGDTLVVFDGTDLQQGIDEKQSELDIAIANRDKNRSSMASSMADLDAQLQNSQASYRIAELRLQQMQFEADIVREEQELSLQQSRISLEQARENINQQKIINEAELKTLELRVIQARNDLEKAKRDLDKLTVIAPQPGLVVYKKIWKGGDMGEVKIGDTPWRGQALLELPDLSIMEVATTVNEVDVAKVEAGQKAVIVPDAFPDLKYAGTVIDVARLARIDENSEAEIKVFDVVVQLDSTDTTLKPGMTVSTTILIKEISDTLSMPLDAVFTDNGETFAYRQSGGYKRVAVELGDRNDNFVVVRSGLEEGQRVSLVDPTKPFDADQWAGQSSVDKESSNGSPSSVGGDGGNGGRGGGRKRR